MAERRSPAPARASGLEATHGALAIATTFLGSLLLFSLEPYVGKLLLPSFGGTPLLWNTCMVFFQVALLLGYLYALVVSRYIPVRTQVVVQVLLLATLFVAYPDARRLTAVETGAPLMQLTATLTRHVLLPFVALSALTTLVQSWFAQSTHTQAATPYRLYAASNAGSMLGLFAYPLLLEPRLSLTAQRSAFLVVLSLVMLAVVGMGATWRRQVQPWQGDSGAADAGAREGETPGGADFSPGAWGRVILLTAIPASLLLGVTNYILTDVASLPLFWVVPLALYLATFIVAFGRRRAHPPAWMGRVFTLCCIFIIVALAAEANTPANLLIPLHLLVFTLGSLLCHQRVASIAPAPRYLPQFYLAVSIGGALGGLVTLLVPPLLTTRMVEYPIALVLATLVLVPTAPVSSRWRDRIIDVIVPVSLVAMALWAVQQRFPGGLDRWVVLVFAPAALFVLGANTRGLAFTLRLGALFAASLLVPSSFGKILFAERSFYGRVRVMHDQERNANVIVHGSTVHGVQRRQEMQGCAPTSYYHPTGPAGHYLAGLAPQDPPRRVALIGLGAGALACYARPGEAWDFFELDPTVARLASDTTFFTYLAHSPSTTQRIVVGDARLALAREPAARYDIVIVDAFSSDAIPIHLLTREAIEGYVRTLTPSGVMLFHVSNRFFRLPPVLAAAAGLVQWEAFVNDDPYVTPAEFAAGKYESEWVNLARAAEGRTLGPRWRRITGGSTRGWTDDYSNPLGAMGVFARIARAASPASTTAPAAAR